MKRNKEINILFLGGGKRVSLGEKFIESANAMNLNVNIFSYELGKPVPISTIAEIIIGLKWNSVQVISHIKNVVGQHNINIILPCVDPATIVAARLKMENLKASIMVSSEEICNMFFDKVEADKWFQENGFPVPGNNSELPLIAKPIKGSASKGIFIIRNRHEMDYFENTFNREGYLIQNYIAGEEYTVDSYISKDGEILGIVPRKRIEVTAGEVTKALTVRHNGIIDLTEKIIKRAGFIGPVTVQFIHEKTSGKLFVIEVNPRIGGGVLLSIRSGMNIVNMIIMDYLCLKNEVAHNWKDNLLMLRAHREFFYDANNS